MIPDQELYGAYFQKDAEYYIDKVEHYDAGRRFVYNPYPFFLGVLWFLYRKMYLEVAVIFLVMLVEKTIESVIMGRINYQSDVQRGIDIIVAIIFACALSSLANFLYVRKAKRIIAKAQAQGMSDEQLISYLRRKGGVDYWRFPLSIILFIALILLLSYMGSNSNHVFSN